MDNKFFSNQDFGSKQSEATEKIRVYVIKGSVSIRVHPRLNLSRFPSHFAPFAIQKLSVSIHVHPWLKKGE
jgi:hypothetical protein